MIVQREKQISLGELKHLSALPSLLMAEFQHKLIRWFISRVEGDQLTIDLTVDLSDKPVSEIVSPVNPFPAGQSVIVNIVPTGIGCSYGGYAADAAPVNSLLAKCADFVVCNPNTVNASNFIQIDSNVLYTEGYLIDQFCSGSIDLCQPYHNRVGLIIEKTTPENLEYILNIANATRAIHGVDVAEYIMTDEEFGVYSRENPSGAYTGEVRRPEMIRRACRDLVARGVNAIAITSNVNGLHEDKYAAHFSGHHPNPVGGVEAIISHMICREFGIPAAHAPMINFESGQLTGLVDPRGAGEYVSKSGLACVLMGLRQAAAPYVENRHNIRRLISAKNILAVVAPASALGGIPMIAASTKGIPLIAVRDNETVINVTRHHLGLKNVIEVNNYLEAAGVLLALRENIGLDSLNRPVHGIVPAKEKQKKSGFATV